MLIAYQELLFELILTKNISRHLNCTFFFVVVFFGEGWGVKKFKKVPVIGLLHLITQSSTSSMLKKKHLKTLFLKIERAALFSDYSGWSLWQKIIICQFGPLEHDHAY